MAQTDPYRSYSFKLEIDGVVEAHFTECSGLSTKIETIAYREAGDHQLVRPIPGPVDYAAVTLKYGVTKSRRLFDWMMKTAGGEVQRRDVSIVLLDSQGGSEVLRWNLLDAFPSEWKGAALPASEKSVAIESLSLVFDRLERVSDA